MADPHNLDNLPPELQAMILELLPISARKAMRLVSKHYIAEASKALWADTTIDIDSERPLEDLLVASPHGFVDNVRRLSTAPHLWSADIEDRVGQLLTKLFEALPRNRLLEFHSKDFAISKQTLEALFTKQLCLSKLSILTDHHGLPDIGLIRDSLDELQSVQIILEGSKEIYRDTCILLQHTPHLRELKIEDTKNCRYPKSWPSPLPMHWPNLRHLAAASLDLARYTDSTASSLFMPQLRFLELDHCRRPAGFLDLVAGRNEGSGCPCLETFICRSDGQFRTYYDAQILLRSLSGLTTVVLDVDDFDLSTQLPFLSRVGPSINAWKELQLTLCDDWPVCHDSDLEYIVASCKELERLIVTLVNLEPRGAGSTHGQQDFPDCKEQLAIIAGISSLKRLSLVSCIHESPRDTAEERKLWYAQFADSIMDTLTGLGSNVEVLDFSSIVTYGVLIAERDGNGHTWPHYSYRKGSVTFAGYEGQKTVKTIAIPIPFVEITTLSKFRRWLRE
ncbi:hypothetical protein E8E13_007098 [Curvularia kusanoi]|uniref:F-box domain-containing protein n=1 Tax=Curvularia kusanoi TaxID=90978 RepID=A0A9P4W5S0_CURKU|nr:hypothetical protein E8E13_007098 [Curvularia kusanoi]